MGGFGPSSRRTSPSTRLLRRNRPGRADMHVLVQAIIFGVLTGGVYALMASGQTLIFGIMKVVNLAQAAFVVLAAYLTFSLFRLTGLDPFLSILITTPLMFAVGAAIQWTLLRPLRPDEVSQLSLL